MHEPVRISPLVRAIVICAAAVFTVAIFFIGIAVFIALFGLAIVALVAVRARLWWLNRKFGRRHRTKHQPSGRLIEGEYAVVRRRRRGHRH
jgi:membrane protein implicated in regulation of membrane protease activity